MEEKYIPLVFSLAIAMAIAPLGVVAAFGQHDGQDAIVNPDLARIEANNPMLEGYEHLTIALNEVGFYNKITVGYSEESGDRAIVTFHATDIDVYSLPNEDVAAEIGEFYGYDLVEIVYFEDNSARMQFMENYGDAPTFAVPLSDINMLNENMSDPRTLAASFSSESGLVQ